MADEEIDPNLLKDSGRASAIQDLAKQAKELSDRGVALEKTTIEETAKNNKILKFQNKLLIYAVIILLLMGGAEMYRNYFVSGPRLAAIDDTVQGPISHANTKLDEILMFIEETEADSVGSNDQLQDVFDAVYDVRNILCSSNVVEAELCN